MITIVGWIGFTLSMIGYYFVIKKNVIGFYVWSISNVVLLIIGIVQKDWPQAALFLCYSITNVIGIRQWRKDIKDFELNLFRKLKSYK